MSVFSDAEIAEYNKVMEYEQGRAAKGCKPQVSSILMSLLYGISLPLNDNGKMWFNDNKIRNLLVSSVKKLMNDHQPSEFSPMEKALMFSILQTAFLYEMKVDDSDQDEDDGDDSFMADFDRSMGDDEEV
jgi:hypothetical protein